MSLRKVVWFSSFSQMSFNCLLINPNQTEALPLCAAWFNAFLKDQSATLLKSPNAGVRKIWFQPRLTQAAYLYMCVCVCVSVCMTWYLSEWWASSDDRGETTGDSPSRLMCTDNSIDWRDREKQNCLFLCRWSLLRHCLGGKQSMSSPYTCHMKTNKIGTSACWFRIKPYIINSPFCLRVCMMTLM